MKLKFKHQKFQEEAATAVCDVFAGQPCLSEINYLIDRGDSKGQGEIYDFTGFKNHKIVPQLTDEMILENIRKIQRTHLIPPSSALEGKYNLTIEMETGTGKTYTYIKTMYELNKRYGWSKFIIVVPSIAIREGVFKSFQITQEHFTEDYGKKIRFFIYNSSQLTEIAEVIANRPQKVSPSLFKDRVLAETGLTRNTVVRILSGIEKPVFDQFMLNPEEFILKCSNLINEEKATVIIQHIAYNRLNDSFGTEIFTEPTLKGKLGVNAIAANKHLYDYVIFDSPSVEKPFAEQLDISSEVSVYVKLPKGFYINTPVGKYNPDWAIAFNEGTVKHVYFVAETKGDISTMELREVESAKISCARKHFQAISSDKVKFDVVSNYQQLMSLVK